MFPETEEQELKLENVHIIQKKLNQSLFLINKYNTFVNSYVLDFFIDRHWEQLSASWRQTFSNITPLNLASLFTETKQINSTIIFPLSILCLKVLVKDLSISRELCKDKFKSYPDLPYWYEDRRLRNIFSKKIKTKKRHEIYNMSQLCVQSARDTQVKYVIDFGAGLGHLSRLLAYGFGLNVCCLEQQIQLTRQAIELDNQYQKMAEKYLKYEDIERFGKIKYLNMTLTTKANPNEFFQNILETFNISKAEECDFRFGIIGLHPCGDLSSILINIFLKCCKAKFINIVGCCYMKLSIDTRHKDSGGQTKVKLYPLSRFIEHHQTPNLSYEAREISCHAIETYAKNLIIENFDHLRVHSYRAVLECIILKYWPERKRAGMKKLHYSNELTFEEYCQFVTDHFNIHVPDTDIKSMETLTNLSNWKLVVIFYTLRLMFAPLIESVLLYDRLLCLIENECIGRITTVFDPEISPRNHILLGKKS